MARASSDGDPEIIFAAFFANSLLLLQVLLVVKATDVNALDRCVEERAISAAATASFLAAIASFWLVSFLYSNLLITDSKLSLLFKLRLFRVVVAIPRRHRSFTFLYNIKQYYIGR